MSGQGHDVTSNHVPRQGLNLNPSSTTRGGILFCILVGLVTFGFGMAMGEGVRTWGSLIFNVFFFFAIALGGVAFSGMQDVIGATWGRPIIRIHEAFASFLPIATALILGLFVCISFKIGHADEVYKWIKDPSIVEHMWGKRDWLRPGFWMARDVIALVLILVLAAWQLRHKVGRDLAAAKGGKADGEGVRLRLRYWSAPILVVYALAFSLLAFDLLMALAPTWVSTLWGGWCFAIMMQTTMAMLLLFMFWLKDGPIGSVVRRRQFHDVGKLMHGFTIFFAYLTYAHVLTYWYGNMPEETEYFIHRLHGPWLAIVIVAPLLAFVFPLFALIPKPAKWTATFTVPISLVVLMAQWLVYLLVVIPEVADAATWSLPWIEIGLFFGILGLFLASVFAFGKRFPMLSVGDPLLAEALAEHH